MVYTPLTLTNLHLHGYKAFRDTTNIGIRPLTVVVGRNSAGKSALLRSLHLLAGALSPACTSPLPLQTGGIVHAITPEDLATDRKPHALLSFGLSWKSTKGNTSIKASFRITSTRHEAFSKAVTEEWKLSRGKSVEEFEKPEWRGLLPHAEEITAEPWLHEACTDIRAWSTECRYLRSPRRTETGIFALHADVAPFCSDGTHVAQQLARDPALANRVGEYCQRLFGVELSVEQFGMAALLKLRSAGREVSLAQSGQGISQALPLLALLGSDRPSGGVDIVEHPEAELHPNAHAHIADILIDSRVSTRPLVVETHSEILLLRIRRRIAEGILSPEDVAVYWIDANKSGYSSATEIRIGSDGSVSDWPEGVFYEDYEEILAIRRANALRKVAK